MKKLILFVIAAASSMAMAQTFDFPDFSLETRYEMNYIANNSSVKDYVKRLGATSFTVNTGKPALLSYGVATNNGCSFDVEVVYNSWPGIDNLIISDATCH
jgi:hypothetical protein